MFNLLIFGFIASHLALLHGLVIDFKDSATNYSLHLTTSSIVGTVGNGLKLNDTDLEANFVVTAIDKVYGKIYTNDLLFDDLYLELVPAIERVNGTFSLYTSSNTGSGVVAKPGDLGVNVDFWPTVALKSTTISPIANYTWTLWLNFRKQNATSDKAEGFELFSYAIKSRYYESGLLNVNYTQVVAYKPFENGVSQRGLSWYANSQYASNFLCSNSTISFSGGKVIFNDLRVAANLNPMANNTVYAVCSQDCSVGDINCLRQGDNCTTVDLECPKYTPPVESSAAYTYNFFTLSSCHLFCFQF
uniref:Uncharacterized protein n=1 Tax=Ditylenchus dipsaci TaxID=166011 RepID=A0A915DBH3_9BILA